ncbi:Heavy metal-associated isoprenylated plant protein 47 [Cardamine amara subsp. amara]|uniref:Heavy metal-associated isoprenylated plant protein 47 n=1 Tax=Cardamine amara subsp. amara TaxID=228776 RepID=A0ABD0ZSX7_CARAN
MQEESNANSSCCKWCNLSAIEGEFKDELVVVGDGVDAACLVIALRKKACHVTLETLEEVKPSSLNQKKPQVDEKSVTPHCCIAQCPNVRYVQPLPDNYVVVCDSYGPTGCTIM